MWLMVSTKFLPIFQILCFLEEESSFNPSQVVKEQQDEEVCKVSILQTRSKFSIFSLSMTLC